jgi:hypothetical protein
MEKVIYGAFLSVYRFEVFFDVFEYLVDHGLLCLTRVPRNFGCLEEC